MCRSTGRRSRPKSSAHNFPDEYVAGSNTIDAATGEIPDPRTAFVDPVDDATVARLTQMLVGRFVVRDTALAPVADRARPRSRSSLTTSTGSAPAAATDSGLERPAREPGSPALRAQRVMAALAEIAYEAPSQARGVVLAMPDQLVARRRVRDDPAARPRRDPLVRAGDARHALLRGPAAETDGVPLQRPLAPLPPTRRAAPRGRRTYAAARGSSRRTRRWSATTTRRSRPAARAAARAVDRQHPRRSARVSRAPSSGGSTSLTSGIYHHRQDAHAHRAARQLPLSFQNNTGRAGIRVRVHLESPKLIFPKGPTS